MPVKLVMLRYNMSYQPDCSWTWKEIPCTCAPAGYAGMIPYYDPAYYLERFMALNEANKKQCEDSVYDNPKMYSLDNNTSPCLSLRPKA